MALGGMVFSTAASAENYLGGLIGVSFVSNGGGTNLVYGANAGTKITPFFSLGGYFTYESAYGNNINGFNFSSGNVVVIAAEGNYYLFGDNSTYIGAKLGYGNANISSTGPNNLSSGGLAFGPAVGYNYAIGTGFTVGGEANFIVITTSGSSTNLFDLLGKVTFWF